MGRKDLTIERQTLILDAMERCIGKYGLQGTTLENIAAEAGINRGLIHHYVGNRNDVIRLMAERILEKYQSSFEAYAATRPDSSHIEIVIDYYFDAWIELPPQDDAIVHAMLAESERNAHIRKVLIELIDGFHHMIARELQQLYPDANPARLHAVAYTVMSLAFAHSSFLWLGLEQSKTADVRSVAANLVQTLQ